MNTSNKYAFIFAVFAFMGAETSHAEMWYQPFFDITKLTSNYKGNQNP